MVSGGCIIAGAHIQNSLIFSNVSVDSYTKIDSSVILPDVTIGQNCRIIHAVIDKGCEIADGTVIGKNKEEDEKRFYVSPNGVVLVTPDMLGQAIHDVG
jgi:glucose-1-phosphate adenylyltransferase